jgi:hypothetical protein
MVDRRPQHVVQRRRRRDAPAEVEQVLGPPRCRPHRLDLRLQPRRKVADKSRDDQEEEDRQDVLAPEDVERVVRHGEQEIIGEEAEHAGIERRPQPEAQRHDEHGRNEGERDVRHASHGGSERRPMPTATASVAQR